MVKRYTVEYDGLDILLVTIDHEKADPHIKEMVEFWAWWQGWLAECKGDYTKAFLRRLARYALLCRRLPDGDEGWAPFTPEYGLQVQLLDEWEPDMGLVGIVAKDE